MRGPIVLVIDAIGIVGEGGLSGRIPVAWVVLGFGLGLELGFQDDLGEGVSMLCLLLLLALSRPRISRAFSDICTGFDSDLVRAWSAGVLVTVCRRYSWARRSLCKFFMSTGTAS